MALGGEVVNFVGFEFVEKFDERAAVAEVAVMEVQEAFGTALEVVKMFDAFAADRTRAADEAVNFVALLNEESSEGRSRPVR